MTAHIASMGSYACSNQAPRAAGGERNQAYADCRSQTRAGLYTPDCQPRDPVNVVSARSLKMILRASLEGEYECIKDVMNDEPISNNTVEWR